MKGTRDDIISLADQLIRTRGFNAFSYADIAGKLGIRNAAIHYHFPTKTHLGIAVIDQELQRIADNELACANLPGDQQLQKLIETFYGNSRNGNICLNGSMTPDFDTFAPALRQKVAEMSSGVLDWMTQCLEKGRREGVLQFEGKAEDRALLVMSSLLSALLLSRVLGPAIFDRMMNQLLQDVRATFRIGAND